MISTSYRSRNIVLLGRRFTTATVSLEARYLAAPAFYNTLLRINIRCCRGHSVHQFYCLTVRDALCQFVDIFYFIPVKELLNNPENGEKKQQIFLFGTMNCICSHTVRRELPNTLYIYIEYIFLQSVREWRQRGRSYPKDRAYDLHVCTYTEYPMATVSPFTSVQTSSRIEQKNLLILRIFT